jgi:hypothetical protein
MPRALSKDLRKAVEFAGLDPREDGRISRPLSPGLWESREVAPDLATDADGTACLALTERLVEGADLGNFGTRRSDAGVIEAFTGLDKGSDQEVLSFARRYGALELCVHGLRAWHEVPWQAEWPSNPGGLVGLRCSSLLTLQPTELYRRYAARVASLVRIAAALHGRGAPARSDLRLLSTPWGQPRPVGSGLSPRELVAAEVGRWLDAGSVRPIFSWTARTPPRIELRGIGLWAVIGRQLAFLAARADGLAWCSGCGNAFVPSRKPRLDARSWCQASGCRRAARRQAVRDHRARERSPR